MTWKAARIATTKRIGMLEYAFMRNAFAAAEIVAILGGFAGSRR